MWFLYLNGGTCGCIMNIVVAYALKEVTGPFHGLFQAEMLLLAVLMRMQTLVIVWQCCPLILGFGFWVLGVGFWILGDSS